LPPTHADDNQDTCDGRSHRQHHRATEVKGEHVVDAFVSQVSERVAHNQSRDGLAVASQCR
jgi:hypothetical protein